MQAADIEKYLSQLGEELQARGVETPLHIHVPSKEYVLALKMIAGRDKDIDDSKILLQQTNIKTRQQSQELLDRYIPPLTQQINADGIARSFKDLFVEQESK